MKTDSTRGLVTEVPFVSVIIPCRNEAQFIGGCLESVIANGYPPDRLEILVVDGDSEDRTVEIVREYAVRHRMVRLVRNPLRIIPAAMNAGIRGSRGEIILKIDAHADYDQDYIASCVRRMDEYAADCVGGVLQTVPSRPCLVGHAIAAVLAHPFGSGNAAFRIGVTAPRWTDTAAFGCYRRAVFERIGLYDERLVRSSDMDLNTRLRRAAGRILLAPDIKARYYCRSEVFDFIGRNFLDGYWALYPLRFKSRLMKVRHLLPLACTGIGVLALVGGVAFPPLLVALAFAGAVYAACALAASSHIAWLARDPRFGVIGLPLFFLRHAAYGLGSAWGAVRGVGGRLADVGNLNIGMGSGLAKRLIDVSLSLIGLLLLAPVLGLVAVAVQTITSSPAFYRGTRIGRSGRPFQILKFRTMRLDAEQVGGSSTPDGDPRVTPVGAFLRRYKLDELPQLWNVLVGDMSLVGPRPQVPWAVERYTEEEKILLTVRPGITDPASLRFANEGEILRGYSDPDRAYFDLIHPEKIRLSIHYVKNRSFLGDLRILGATVGAALGRRSDRTRPPGLGTSTT